MADQFLKGCSALAKPCQPFTSAKRPAQLGRVTHLNPNSLMPEVARMITNEQSVSTCLWALIATNWLVSALSMRVERVIVKESYGMLRKLPGKTYLLSRTPLRNASSPSPRHCAAPMPNAKKRGCNAGEGKSLRRRGDYNRSRWVNTSAYLGP
ncbi:hypothetical protein BC629DRAFT_906457 [Irpex lacteus]|nr:hypothetical protein BC629DRAFT_906457 [Irpex lacteus]